ncbi:MAG: isoprenylcysteine carboxylmethyltransferase family protein [Gammaproteobacteria bacterium]|nr:isoprenylcysteine carboxylmethyltransferase family protein [Gammaproteobacteria bacterium]MYC24315.1 isoprenylcysteine carboxylmethyltransferase family protein [Gammaproteobacteria bacterium]
MNTTLFCYVVLAILIFGFRVVIQKKRTGDTGLRVSTQLSSPVQRVATYLQIVVLLAVLTIVILESLGTLKPHFEIATVGKIVGLTLCGLGATLTMVSQYQMGESWRIGVDETEKTELVTHGMFSYSRNPIYCGMLIVGLGFLVLVPHTFMAMSFILAFIGIDLQVRKIEEPHLERVFGEEYDEYTRRTNRYILWVPKS